MMTNDDVWGKLVSLLMGASNLQGNHSVTATIDVRDQNTLDSVLACLSNEEAKFEITSGEDASNLSVGSSINIRCYPRIKWGRITNDLDSLLNTPKARIKEPRRYVLLYPEFTTMSDTVAHDSDLSKYRKVIEVISIFKEAAAFLNEDDQCLVFIDSGRFDIPVSYSVTDLGKVDLSDLEKLVKFLPEDAHRKQCQAIMAEAIISLTKSQPESKRFKYLLEHLPDLLKCYEDGYQLFASGFSYEKIKDQVEAARIEYTGKIHKVLSDIQNQLLGIPVATIIVATQMKQAADIGYSFWINSAVLLGCWIFSVLMIFLIHNQFHTLNVINEEVRRQKNQMEAEFALIKSSFESVFFYLFKRIRTQRIVLWVLGVFLVSALVVSHVIYFKLTPLAAEVWISFVELIYGLAGSTNSQ
ncbi:hypothetical protein HOP54_09510 [Halomonas daqingensis]|uniref:Uncharacterized protein n=1 Tax=Billgrantia desiderata TaxID=52021 RepID=A0ABS9B3Q3_9GAMM|nr:hypothetical protein [Halomonas desiderata]MCE8013418.1 hypothetical protein [Halomonas desiderata]MCE8028927.1 hypothetical protein [Halomonas desiderata]MCE8042138.1 hypothetical protein [Halomonas desiderata]MCE8046717.1 hypothetical protein [Halomonas desiderata]